MRPMFLFAVLIEQLAWTGWIFFGGLLLLYYRLWTSSSSEELRKLKLALGEAHATIDELRKLEIRLKNRNEELSTANHKLHGEYLELRGQFSELNKAYGKLGEVVHQLRDDLNREKALRDEQYRQWMHEKAKHGDL